MTQPVSVAVLAGGQSKRMGTDKALLRLWPDDKPLLQIVVDRVRPLSDDIFVVSNDRPAYGSFGVPVLRDLYPDAAVLGGIGSALRHARNELCLVVSCDHPFLDRSLLAAMLETEGDWDVLVPVQTGESRQGGRIVRHTLHAVYRRTCIPAIERSIAGSRLQIISFFDDVVVRELGSDFIARYDPDFRSFFSVNTPEALETARRWLRSAF